MQKSKIQACNSHNTLSQNIISVAILGQRVDITALHALYMQLRSHFAYFEILLLNPLPHNTAHETTATTHSALELLYHTHYNFPPPPPLDSHTNAPYIQESSRTTQASPKLESSLDSSFASIITQSIPNCRILQISSPLGSYANLGSLRYEIFLQNCIGDYVLFMDLSSDPIESAITMLKRAESFDMVIGIRKNKLHNSIQTLFSKIFYKAFHILGNGSGKEYLSEFCVLSRKVIHSLLRTQDNITLLRFLDFDSALTICEIPYTPLRSQKKSLKDSINLALDTIIGSSYTLLRLGTCLSLILSGFNAIYAAYIIFSYIFLPHIASGWTSTALYMVLMNTGVFFIFAILGEYIRVLLMRQKGAEPYEIIDEQSSVVFDFRERNITEYKELYAKS